MQRRTGLVLAAAIACLGALTAMTGSINAPATTSGASYEPTVPWEALLLGGEEMVTGLVNSEAGSGESGLGLGPSAVTTQLGNAIVLGGWVLIAFRMMDRVAGVLSAVSTVALAAVCYLLFVGGPVSGQATALAGVPVELRLWLLTIAVVVVSAAVVLSLPERFHRPNKRTVKTSLLSRVPTTEDDRDETVTYEPTPSNPVERAWWEVARQIDHDAWATQTPREIERKATDAGLSQSTVRDLRMLFEQVRYGGAPASENRQERARELCERLTEHGGDFEDTDHRERSG